MADSHKIYRNMRLFGLPYQFTPLVDPRVEEVTGEIGRKYAENIMLDAPVITIIPGEPSFLPGTKKKQTITQNILNGGTDSWESLRDMINSESNSKNAYRYYDFKRAYTEYMKYVNILCRACATFLELEDYGFSVDGKVKPFTQYDWRNYRWNTEEALNEAKVSELVSNMRSDEDTWAILMDSMQSTVEAMTEAPEEEEYQEIDINGEGDNNGENGDGTNNANGVENSTDNNGTTTNSDDKSTNNNGDSGSTNNDTKQKSGETTIKGYYDETDNSYYDINGRHYDSLGNRMDGDIGEEGFLKKIELDTFKEVTLPFEIPEEKFEEVNEDSIDVIGVNRSADRLIAINAIADNPEEREKEIDLYITDTILSSYGVDGVAVYDENGVEVIDENGDVVLVPTKNFQYGTTSSTEENTFTDTVLEYAETLLSNFNFVQFYIDPNSADTESLTNNCGDSMLKSIFDNGSNMFKEMGFILNSGGIGTANNETMAKLQDFTSGAMQSLSDHLSGNALTGVLGRVLSLSGNVVRGDNVIFPEVYQNSDYSKSYSVTVHLKSPYGNKLAYYLDICVPLMHLLALGIPRQSSANTYSSPFLVKAYVEGVFTCNMGLVTNMTITRGANDSSMTIDGLPTEVDVNFTLQDLYCELTMTPQSSPLLFINNTSLIEYLSVTCGISLITPNLTRKMEMIVSSFENAIFDIPKNVVSGATETLQNWVMQWDVLHLGS